MTSYQEIKSGFETVRGLLDVASWFVFLDSEFCILFLSAVLGAPNTWLLICWSSCICGWALQVVGSLEKLYHDGATLHPDKDPVKFVVTELKGDWKWQQDSWFCLIRNKSSIFCRLPIWVKICKNNIKKTSCFFMKDLSKDFRNGSNSVATTCAMQYAIAVVQGCPLTSLPQPTWGTNFVITHELSLKNASNQACRDTWLILTFFLVCGDHTPNPNQEAVVITLKVISYQKLNEHLFMCWYCGFGYIFGVPVLFVHSRLLTLSRSSTSTPWISDPDDSLGCYAYSQFGGGSLDYCLCCEESSWIWCLGRPSNAGVWQIACCIWFVQNME